MGFSPGADSSDPGEWGLFRHFHVASLFFPRGSKSFHIFPLSSTSDYQQLAEKPLSINFIKKTTSQGQWEVVFHTGT
jgi:hypothetical protein